MTIIHMSNRKKYINIRPRFHSAGKSSHVTNKQSQYLQLSKKKIEKFGNDVESMYFDRFIISWQVAAGIRMMDHGGNKIQKILLECFIFIFYYYSRGRGGLRPSGEEIVFTWGRIVIITTNKVNNTSITLAPDLL